MCIQMWYHALFETFGSRCFELSIEELEKEKARLAARDRAEHGDGTKRSPADGDKEMESELPTPDGSPKKGMAGQKEEGTKQLLSTRSADSALLARLEEISWKLTNK